MDKHIIFYLMFFPTVILFIWGMSRRVSIWLEGTLERTEHFTKREKLKILLTKGWINFWGRPVWYIKTLIIDVIFHRKLFSQSLFRWLAHTLIVFGFVATFIVDMIKGLTTGYLAELSHSVPFFSFALAFKTGGIRPFLDFFLEFFSFLILVGCVLAMIRRFFIRPDQLKTEEEDIVTLFFILYLLLSGFFIEGYRIAHPEVAASRVFMADFTPASSNNWVSFFGYFLSLFLKDITINPHFLWYAHVIPCLVWFVYIPHSKLLHIFTASMSVISDRQKALVKNHETSINLELPFGSGLPSAQPPIPFDHGFHGGKIKSHAFLNKNFALFRSLKKIHPKYVPISSMGKNLSVIQLIGLEACVRCGNCSEQCSVAIAFKRIPNINILPSQKIASIKALVFGKALSPQELRDIQEGVYLCTNCLRCTVVCPVSINLQDLWFTVREILLQRGYPEFLMLSPLSFYRGLMREEMLQNDYQKPLIRAREAIADQGELMRTKDKTLHLTPADRTFQTELNLSAQAKNFSACFGCQTCTTVCPVVTHYENPQEALGLLPHQIMHATGLGLRDLAFGSNMLWDCLTCYQCQEQCPRGVCVTDVLYEIKNLAIQHAKKKMLQPEERR